MRRQVLHSYRPNSRNARYTGAAVEAVIWGMPIVSLNAMRQPYFRDGKAKYGDIIWWPKGNGWKNQSLTPNTSVRYSLSASTLRTAAPNEVTLAFHTDLA